MISTMALSVSTVTLRLRQTQTTPPEIEAVVASAEHSFQWFAHRLRPEPLLFGVAVPSGRLHYFVERARVRSKGKFFARLKAAPIGESIPLTLTALTPIRLTALGRAISLLHRRDRIVER
jgi:hypothetical protein